MLKMEFKAFVKKESERVFSIIFLDNEKEYEVPNFILPNDIQTFSDIIDFLNECIDKDRKTIDHLNKLPMK